MIMHKNPFETAKPVVQHLKNNGYNAYFVGGCVRDMFLGRAIGDIDIATSAKPEQVQQLFRKVIPVGVEHGTVIVRYQGESYEVTTFRLDGTYSDNRHPDHVAFIKTIAEDLKRRDFTMNALAMDQNGYILDPFGGKQDLEQKRIRTVGKASDRFREDPLRMIRALRFSSQLGFTIESETLASMTQEQARISDLAIERVTAEMIKLFAGDYVRRALDYLRRTAIDRYIPVLAEHSNLITMLPAAISPLYTFAEVITLFHLLYPNITIETWATHWKISNKQKKEAAQLADSWERYQQVGLDPWLVYRLDNKLVPAFIRLGQNLAWHFRESPTDIQQKKEQIPIDSLQDLEINGNDLIKLFPNRQKGAWIKQSLAVLEKKVVFGELVNEKNELKEWIKWNPPVTS